MSKRLSIDFDSGLIESISSDFNLRKPNHDALRQLVFTLSGGDYDPAVMQVLALATGVGKTYLMAAFIEYLRRQGVGNVVIVTPGKVVQAKTIQNFAPGSSRYIAGSQVPPEVVTPQDYSAWITRRNGPASMEFGHEAPALAFIFNIQQLIAPTNADGDTRGSSADATRRRPRRFDENAGVLFDYLKELEDLVVIADESHLYSESAAAFNSALHELDPAACVGLTASALEGDEVIYRYPLYQAIHDKYVKAPVLAFRKGGYGEDDASEEQQLSDAMQLRAIKQRFYDGYAERNGLRNLNAVMFVVCADTDHATQVAELLRSPRYFDGAPSVLQVDSKHDDPRTQALLEGLDEPDSHVLAVVSVNKLKEGWDVKNIAVIVTLRAMASEVLTQQTMGRGLRLPFGSYTRFPQIDQLDIISHQSFRELLAAENVLVQFGLEDAVSEADRPHMEDAIRQAAESGTGAQASPVGGAPNGTPNAPAHGAYGKTLDDRRQPESPAPDNAPSLGVREMGGYAIGLFDEKDFLSTVSIGRNPEFADVYYLFPCTMVEMTKACINIADISELDIERAAKRVSSTGDVLVRKEIFAALGKSLWTVDTESAEVESLHIEEDTARQALVKLVMKGNLIPVTEENRRLAEGYLVKKFMRHVPFEQWTVKSLGSATVELNSLVREFVNEALRRRSEETRIIPKEMPATDHLDVPLGDSVYEPVDTRADFEPHRFYSGWLKSLFEAESFDSYTGEYLLAKLLNTSPSIKWWHRLHPSDNAYIYYNSKDRYFPDFVALDVNGIRWIIEGKDQRGKTDNAVQAKCKAAEGVVHRLVGLPEFSDQEWGYLIAYEDDIVDSDSWDELKSKSRPVSNE